MKLLKRIAEHADLYRMGTATFAGLLLAALFVLTQPVDQQRHNAQLRFLGQLQRDEARLGESVLELNFSLSNNYDNVNAIYKRMQKSLAVLQTAKGYKNLHSEENFRLKLHLFEQRLSAQASLLEKFKSSNAVLKNSLIYLPHARDELERDLSSGNILHERLDDLVEQVLWLRTKGGLAENTDFEAALHAVQSESYQLPANFRFKLDQLINHIRNIDRITLEMPDLVRQLSSNTETTEVAAAYQLYYDKQQQRAATFRVFLFLATLLLLSYIIRVLVRLRQQASQLKLAASVFATASDGITITDTEGIILEVNPAFVAVTGYSRAEVIGKNPRILRSGRQDKQFYDEMWRSLNETEQWQGEIWNRRKNGDIFPEYLRISAVKDTNGVITNFVGAFSDITLAKKAEDDIKFLAFYDPLTGLPNRRLLLDRLHQAMAASARSGREGALLFIDLDNFKTINDTLGHYVGDHLLQQVALRVQSCVREGDTVARLGGDEFVIMLENLSAHSIEAAEQTKTVAEKILDSLNQPYQLAENEYRNTPSIGATLFNDQQHSIDELLKQADIAMYQAKKSGRNALRFFDPQMQDAINTRAALEDLLRRAIDTQQFQLYYQIQVDSEGHALGAEALIRWPHPERGLVSPAEFIPLAEDTGLILPIGQWVLETACAQLKSWEQETLTRALTLCVNVSAKQFRQADFVEQMTAAMQRHAINPKLLKLELTESLFVENIEDTIATMNTLNEVGVQFSLDDFGTGYSSLQYLKRLPLDQLKIDQSFVRDIATDNSDKAIVRTIIAMANSMNLNVIAEGVETLQQRQLLLDKGCTHFQGYLFGKPAPIAQFEALLKQAALRDAMLFPAP